MAFWYGGMLKLAEGLFVYDAQADDLDDVTSAGYFDRFRLHMAGGDIIILITENGAKGNLSYVSSETHAAPVTLVLNATAGAETPEWPPEGATETSVLFSLNDNDLVTDWDGTSGSVTTAISVGEFLVHSLELSGGNPLATTWSLIYEGDAVQLSETAIEVVRTLTVEDSPLVFTIRGEGDGFYGELEVTINVAETPAWLPEGAVAYADFVDENYYMDGAECEAADMFGTDPDSGNLWAATAFDGTIGANGYVGDGSASAVSFLGAARSALLAGATVVLHMHTATGGGGSGVNLVLGSNDANYSVVASTFDSNTDWKISGNWSGTAATATNQVTHNAQNKLAVTMTNTRAEVSANGGAAVVGVFEEEDWDSVAMTIALIDGVTNPIRSITIYAPVADAALPALSAL